MDLNEAFFHDGSGGPANVDITYSDLYGDNTNGTTGSGANRRGRKRRLQRQGDPTSERDGCTSIACPAGYKSAGANNKDGVFPCEPCQEASLNPYIGANTCFALDEGRILQTLYDATNGAGWTGDGSQNWVNDAVPTCEKRGVSCNANGHVTAIRLANMGLSGTLPPDLGFLSRLTALNVSHNSIGGQIPADLRFAPLELLDVAENLITGFVPTLLCQKPGVNGNGQEGIFTCDTVSCRAGYHSDTGRADPGIGGDKCRLCLTAAGDEPHLGTIDCEEPPGPEAITPFGLVGEIGIALFGLSVFVLLFWVYRRSAVSSKYIQDRAYDIHGPGRDEQENEADFADPNSADVEETDPLNNLDGLGMEVKVKPEWNKDRESSKEVWLDVPKIQ